MLYQLKLRVRLSGTKTINWSPVLIVVEGLENKKGNRTLRRKENSVQISAKFLTLDFLPLLPSIKTASLLSAIYTIYQYKEIELEFQLDFLQIAGVQ